MKIMSAMLLVSVEAGAGPDIASTAK